MAVTPPNDHFPVIIERHLLKRTAPSALPIEVTIEIGRPYWTTPNVEAACPVAIRGDIGRVNDIHGIDPMSAMKLALQFAEHHLASPPEGVKYFWPDGEEY